MTRPSPAHRELADEVTLSVRARAGGSEFVGECEWPMLHYAYDTNGLARFDPILVSESAYHATVLSLMRYQGVPVQARIDQRRSMARIRSVDSLARPTEDRNLRFQLRMWWHPDRDKDLRTVTTTAMFTRAGRTFAIAAQDLSVHADRSGPDQRPQVRGDAHDDIGPSAEDRTSWPSELAFDFTYDPRSPTADVLVALARHVTVNSNLTPLIGAGPRILRSWNVRIHRPQPRLDQPMTVRTQLRRHSAHAVRVTLRQHELDAVATADLHFAADLEPTAPDEGKDPSY